MNPFAYLTAPKGHPYPAEKVESYSYYNTPIQTSNGLVTGNSRIVGDASTVTQETAINAIITVAVKAGLDQSDTALLLAIVRTESGFNPDAAAGTTSAFGLAQTTNDTAKITGLTSSNMWDVNAQATAAVNFFVLCQTNATALGLNDSYIYALWHDGQNIKDIGKLSDGPGMTTYNNSIQPYVSQYLSVLQAGNYGLPITDYNEIDPYTISTDADDLTKIQTTQNAINYTLAYTADGGSCLTSTAANGVTYEYSDVSGQTIFSIINPINGIAALNLPNTSISMPIISTIVPAVDDFSFLINNGAYTFTPLDEIGNSFRLTSSTGTVDLTFNGSAITSIQQSGSNLSLATTSGANLLLNYQNGSGTINLNGTTETINQSSVIQIDPSTIRVSPTGNDGFGIDYGVSPAGILDGSKQGFLELPNNLTFAQDQTDASYDLSATNTAYSVPTQTSVVDTTYISAIAVGPLGSGFAGFSAGGDADLSDLGYASGNVVIGGPGIEVIMPDANDDGVFNNAATNVATDDLQPGQVRYMDASQNETYIVAQQSAASPATQAFYTMLADEANDQNRVADTDPLLIDLTGNGIQVSNWINNGVYFQSNVNGTAKDTSLHHTSWTESGTGMLVFDPTGGAITNITQTVSEYLNVSSNAAAVGSFTDGLAALASLSTSATVFSAATSKTDPNTGHSYWSEIEIATGLPSTSGAIPTAQLETLATALGTTGSISLTGSGNQGQSIAGSAVTNNATYTTAGGTTGAVAAVNLQIDTTGDITYNQANGSVVINSTPEGGASATTSYIDQASTAQSFVLSGGTLTDNGTTVAQQNGEAYNAVFAKTGDTVTVAADMPNHVFNYWLSGPAGTTLNATNASGNILFLAQAGTVVEGGHGFNILQETDSAPVTINLAGDKLQEVIGGAGDGTFDAAGTTWNVFIQGGSGNNIIIGGEAADALAGGTGDDLIEAGPGGSVIHAEWRKSLLHPTAFLDAEKVLANNWRVW